MDRWNSSFFSCNNDRKGIHKLFTHARQDGDKEVDERKSKKKTKKCHFPNTWAAERLQLQRMIWDPFSFPQAACFSREKDVRCYLVRVDLSRCTNNSPIWNYSNIFPCAAFKSRIFLIHERIAQWDTRWQNGMRPWGPIKPGFLSQRYRNAYKRERGRKRKKIRGS